MTTITVPEDCGNSPKKALLRDFNVAFAEGDEEFILETVSDDIEWTSVGERQRYGTGDLASALEEMEESDVAELTIDHVITHGATGAVDGTVTMEDGSAYAFCDVYEFTNTGSNAAIRTMTSYVIEVGDA
ncbi:hypothetical protein EL22_18995 [Halostagnicola sp. A56]|uniref:nuclear transport factor 2 family protein n=1 Tax=Halostagnicola sp. A56 TaxID=1495067 RepID=UPI0004A1505C|nr:nuclear transport factor 2 family protein [Halostagnicola sp. A56]KDE59678.1 hypothetical protein EL22_18995 [Halostagnicola sp. A56]